MGAAHSLRTSDDSSRRASAPSRFGVRVCRLSLACIQYPYRRAGIDTGRYALFTCECIAFVIAQLFFCGLRREEDQKGGVHGEASWEEGAPVRPGQRRDIRTCLPE